MFHGTLAAGFVLCLATISCMSAAETTPQDRTVLRMSGTTAKDLQGALSTLQDIEFKVVTEGGSSVTGLQNLQHGKIDVAMAMADVAYLAYTGQLDTTSPPFDELRGLAVVTLNTLHLIVAKDADVRSISDLRGLRVVLGPAGSATALIAERVLEAYGIPLSAVRSTTLSYVETADKLARGEMDAAFMTQIPPSDPIVRTANAGARLVDIGGPVIEQLRTRYPYLKRTMIPRGTYPYQNESVYTIGVDLLLTCRADVDEDVAYRLLDAYFAMRAGTRPPVDLERAPATPIPLHAGAARYYRQRELSK
jgi:uncharacterized protein